MRRPVFELMFVYMDFASAEKSSALLGRFSCFRSFIISKEFLVYERMRGKSSFIRKSSQVENIVRRPLELLTTGRSDNGDL